MRKYQPDLLIILLLLLLPLAFFAPVTLGSQTLLPVDNLFQWEPFATYADVVAAPDVPHNGLLSDLILENYVWRSFIRESVSGGELPLWNPHLFGGVPFFAAGQHSALYPLSFLHYILPLKWAYGWYVVIQLWLTGTFMYLFTRGIGQRRVGATVAAVSWQLSAFLLVRTVFPMIQSAVSWLPLLLLMIEYVIRSRPLVNRPATLPWAAVGAISLGLVIYAGHVEITYYTLLVLAFYAAVRLLAGWWVIRQEAGALGKLFRRAVWLLVMVGIGMMLGAGQFIPLFELVSHNFREGSATLAQIRGWAYPARHIITFLIPNFYGSPAHHAYWDVFSGQTVQATVNALGQTNHTIFWGIKNYVEGGAYLGLLPMALAVFGLISAWFDRQFDRGPVGRSALRGRPYRGIFALLGGVSVTFVFGTPTYAILYYLLPGINQLHSPFRWIFPLTISVAVLAGFGADALARSRRETNSPIIVDLAAGGKTRNSPIPTESSATDRWARYIGWGFFWAGIAVLFGLLLSRIFFGQIEPHIDRALHSLALADTAFADARMFYSYQFRNVLLFGLFLTATGVIFRVSRCPITLPKRMGRVPVWELLAVLVIALDLMVATAGFIPASDPALLDFTPPAIEWLQECYAEEGPFRITTLDDPGENVLNANMAWMFGLEDVRGYDSIIPRQYTDYMALISPQFQLDYNRVAPLTTEQPWALESPLLNALNVRYVMTTNAIDTEGWTLAYSDEAVNIYENANVMPRAYTLPAQATLTYDSAEAFAALTQQVDLRRAVMVYDPAQPPGAAGTASDADPQPQTITVYGNIQVMVDATVGEESWLVLADSYFDGWRAFIRPEGADEDAEWQVPIALVNGNFRAVKIDPAALADHYAGQDVTLSDTWTVRYRKRPQPYQIGAFLRIKAAAAIVFALGVWLWRTFYLGRDESQDETVQRLAKNSVMPIIMNLFNKGIDFAFAFIMLRVLGPEDAGIYYYAIVVFGWFDILTNFGLNTFLTREVARHRDQAGRYLLNTSAMRLGLAALSVPMLIGFLALRQATVPDSPLDVTAVAAIGLLYLGLLPNSLSTGLSALFYAFEKAEYPAAIATVGTMSKATLGLAALLMGWGVVGLAGVSIITNTLILAIMLWAARPLIWPKNTAREAIRPLAAARSLDRGLLRHMVGESWPLMINHLLATIFYKIDVILMEAINSVTVVGWYSTAYKWLDALQVIPAFLSAALLPVMSRQAQEDPPALVRSYSISVKLLLLTALPVAVATTFLAPTLILVLGGSEYLPDGGIALQLMVWSIPIGWINSVTQYMLIALDRQRILTRAFIIAVVFNVAANLIFLPAYSYRAAAIITILSEALLLVLFLRVLRNTLQDRIPDGAAHRSVSIIRLVLKPGAAAIAMLITLAMLWGISGPTALVTGAVVYVAILTRLQPFDPAEQEQLAPLLPGRRRVRE